MSTEINDLIKHFNKIKDKLHPNTNKNNEFVRVLAAVYKLDPNKADEMWQYVVEQNEKVASNASARNIYLVYNKLFECLTIEDSGNLICMNSERVRILFLNAYAGNYGKMFGTVVGCYIKNGSIDDAVHSIHLCAERYKNDDNKDLFIFSLLIDICSYIEKEVFKCNNRVDSINERIIYFYNAILKDAHCEGVFYSILGEKNMLINEPIVEKESINRIINYYIGNRYYRSLVEFLYLERSVLKNDLVDILFRSLKNHYEVFPVYTLRGNEKEKAISQWYKELIENNKILLELAFENDYCTYCESVLKSILNHKNWNDLIYYLSKGLNQKTDFKVETYILFIKSVINSILREDENELIFENNQWKRKPIVYNNNINIPINENVSSDLTSSTSLNFEFHMEIPYNSFPVLYVCKEDREDFINALNEICKMIVNDDIRKEIAENVERLRKEQ